MPSGSRLAHAGTVISATGSITRPDVTPGDSAGSAPLADIAAAAVDAFYFKPTKAVFRALELGTYRARAVRLEAPVLDLGCGDGSMAGLLRRCGLLPEPPAWGLEIGEADVRAARRRAVHRAVLRGDAYRLPFADGSFRTVLANGVLCSLPGTLEPALAEVRRVLAPVGSFVATVPTLRARDYCWPPLALAAVAPRLRERMVARYERRIQHLIMLGLGDWTRAFREAGFDVGTVAPFYGARAGAACAVLATQPVRVLSALRVAPGLGRRLIGLCLTRTVHALAAADAATGEDEAGYLLIEARKA